MYLLPIGDAGTNSVEYATGGHSREDCHGDQWPQNSLGFNRYNIVNETDLEQAARSLTEYFERKKNTTVGTLAGTLNEAANVQLVQDGTELLGIAEDGIELARGIEPLT